MLALVFLMSLGPAAAATPADTPTHAPATDAPEPAATPDAPAAGAASHTPEIKRLRAALTPTLQALMADSAFKGANVSVAVARASDHAELFSHNGDRTLVPASNIKIITTAAALTTLTPDYQFKTEVYGRLHADGRIEGDLTIKGHGDPYLLPERVWYLCNRLRLLGVREISGGIVVDDTWFGGERKALGWEEDDTSSAYMAPAGALSIGFNAVLVHMYPGLQAGDAAKVILEPAAGYPSVTGKIETQAKGRTSVQADTNLVGDGNGTGKSEVVHVAGHMRPGDAPRGVWRRVNEPSLLAGHTFREILAQVGIKVNGGVKVAPLAPAPLLVRFESPRLADILSPLNKYSNNFMAGQLAFAMGAHAFGAPGTWDKGRMAIEQFLNDQVHLKPGSYTLRNASGLHEVNRFSARQIVQLLSWMSRQPRVYPEFLNSLAVAGGTGTLEDRMGKTRAAHVLRGKTGTLAGACALSGYVPTRDGTMLAFSILVNGFRRVRPVWHVQDRLADTLAGLDLAAPTALSAATETAPGPAAPAAVPSPTPKSAAPVAEDAPKP